MRNSGALRRKQPAPLAVGETTGAVGFDPRGEQVVAAQVAAFARSSRIDDSEYAVLAHASPPRLELNSLRWT